MAYTLLKKSRRLPYNGTILVSPGQEVGPETVVARVNYVPGQLVKHNAVSELAIPPEELESAMTHNCGDRVARGQTLAIAGDFFNRRSSKAPVDGVIAAVSRHLGFVYLREPIETGKAEETEIRVAEILDIPPLRIMDFLATDVGKTVVPDQIIAKRMVDGKWRYVASPLYGKVKSVSKSSGAVVIAPLFKSLDVSAFIRGTVTGVVPGTGVEVACRAEPVQGVFGVGGESWGRLRVIDGDLPVSGDFGGEMVVCTGSASWQSIENLRTAGARGLVLAFVDMMVLVRYVGSEFNPALTGKEDVPFPLVVTEGFLPARMDPAIVRKFRRHEGSVASMSGATQIRAGVIRPEVVLGASPLGSVAGPVESKKAAVVTGGRIRDGDRVRIVRGPGYGVTGNIVRQPAGWVPLKTGGLAQVVHVRTPGGEELVVPRANVVRWNPEDEESRHGQGS